MATLRDVMAYLCRHYPHREELSKARLTKMVYLADWKSAIENDRQLTDIQWEFNHYGPYVEDTVTIARQDPNFVIDESVNMFGNRKDVISVAPHVDYPSLTEEDKQILDFVIEKTKRKYWNDFIRLVYSTYPIVSQPRFSKLDLVELARKYKQDESLFTS